MPTIDLSAARAPLNSYPCAIHAVAGLLRSELLFVGWNRYAAEKLMRSSDPNAGMMTYPETGGSDCIADRIDECNHPTELTPALQRATHKQFTGWELDAARKLMLSLMGTSRAGHTGS